MKNYIKKLAFVAGVIAPTLAAAQLPSPVNPPSTAGPVTSVGGILGLLNTILTWVAYIFWIAAAAFIFYAAFLYLTAAGDPEKVKKASHQFLYAVVAIVVGLMAYGLPLLVQNFLGGH